jgi:hypothetical protein
MATGGVPPKPVQAVHIAGYWNSGKQKSPPLLSIIIADSQSVVSGTDHPLPVITPVTGRNKIQPALAEIRLSFKK